MKQRLGYFLAALATAIMIVGAEAAHAQVTPAEGYTPPDDTPSVKVGGTIFADFTYQQEPQGEAIVFANSDSGFYTLSEKALASEVKLYFYKRNK